MLDPTARVTAILAGLAGLATSTSTQGAADVTVQGTFDTPVGPTLNPTLVWNNLSTQHFSSAAGGGTLITFTGPIAGLRLSSSTFTAGLVTLKALQAVTAGP